jgi:hypothetical protein
MAWAEIGGKQELIFLENKLGNIQEKWMGKEFMKAIKKIRKRIEYLPARNRMH